MEIKKIKASETWKIRHEVMWPDQPFEFVQLAEDDFGSHYGVFDENQLVSIVSCFTEGDVMQFRKLATLNSYQGRGIASLLLKHIFKTAQEKGIKKIWCNARTEKKQFYEKFGMYATGEVFNKAGQEFTIMEITI
ncbi:GNAT family N-acetyltransferase [Flavobacterium panacagri]|uniref:GNAT family N-acetyltransferase n=1 Tax=Flavobacterium panacagri TaxID=3034146 RepID=UPI0025A55776|nr:GNAT family N-acetyltransferase [Flavobacterium panacagri]